MESLVFCKISCMKYYEGASRHDVPYNGGSFVKENGYGHEEYNFFARNIPDGWVDDSGSVIGGDYCLGFVETKSTNANKSNQLHVEKILGFGDSFKTEPCVTRVTVVWCATSDLNETQVVGWYKNATVFREYQHLKMNMVKNAFIIFCLFHLTAPCFHKVRATDIYGTCRRRNIQEHLASDNLCYGMHRRKKQCRTCSDLRTILETMTVRTSYIIIRNNSRLQEASLSAIFSNENVFAYPDLS